MKLPTYPKRGDDIVRWAQEMWRYVRAITLRGHGVSRMPGGTIFTEGPRLGFSGVAYVKGVKTTGLNSDSTKPYVKCSLDTGAAVEDAGPPADPFPEDEEWFEKASTYGDIHVVRA